MTESETFICEVCCCTFTKAADQEAVDAEMKALWGNIPEKGQATVCEDCFQRLMKWVRSMS